MEMTDKDMEAIIRKATENVLCRLTAQPPHGAKAGDRYVREGKLLVVIPDVPGDLTGFINYIGKKYDVYELTLCSYKNADGFSAIRSRSVTDLKDAAARQKLALSINNFEKVVLVSPGIKLMKAITEGDDAGYIESLVIYSLIHGKEVDFLIDFCIKDLPANSFFKNLAIMLDSVASMGIQISEIFGGQDKSEGALLKDRELITEKRIEELWQSGFKSLRCGRECILTPLAKDRAKELGIEII